MRKTPKESNRTLQIVLLAGVILIAGFVSYVILFSDIVPPNTQTALAMNNCKQRIQQYALEHNALPRSLNDTNEIRGSFNSNKDGWNHDILYSYDANGLVTLKSLGKDNKQSGTGNDADIVGIYQSHLMNGNWAGANADWIKDPFKGMRKPKRL